MRIYTRRGDRAETSLVDGSRVSKADPRVEAYGALDELASQVGLARALAGPEHGALVRALEARASEVMTAASWVADPTGVLHGRLRHLAREDVERLEEEMDAMSAELPALSHFILPGGCPLAAALHVCRTVCRRTERRIAALHRDAPVDQVLLAYVNRLADWFFVAARMANKLCGRSDWLWDPGEPD